MQPVRLAQDANKISPIFAAVAPGSARPAGLPDRLSFWRAEDELVRYRFLQGLRGSPYSSPGSASSKQTVVSTPVVLGRWDLKAWDHGRSISRYMYRYV